MNDLLKLLLSILGAFGFAAAMWPMLLRGPKSPRILVKAGCTILVMLFPLIIPAERIGLRALALLVCIELWFKMVDYSRQKKRPDSFSRYLRFLIPFPSLLVVLSERDRRLPSMRSRWPDVFSVIFGGACFGSGFLLLKAATSVAAVQTSFVLDHCLKVAIFVFTIEGLSRLIRGIERLAGYDVAPLMDRHFLAQSVGEFWCRYNTRVHMWSYLNVFQPAGGLRSPVKGLFWVFFVSALFHELGFGIATSRFDGYQFTFFMLQWPAVLLSRRLYRWANRVGTFGKVMTHGSTVLWMTVSSVFFFHGVNRVFPFFYVSDPLLP